MYIYFRQVLITENGVKWRNLPHDFPPWKTVYSFFRRAKINGLWDDILMCLAEMARKANGRENMPSYGIIDSQSARTVYASHDRGMDGGKKVKGRKRHIVVDTQGNILHVEVHAANICDTASGILPLRGAHEKFPSIIAICADACYRGTFVEDARKELGLEVDIVERNKDEGWQILPMRWVVERTFAWFGNYRRLSRDYEYSTCSEVAFIQISHIHILLRRLAITM